MTVASPRGPRRSTFPRCLTYSVRRCLIAGQLRRPSNHPEVQSMRRPLVALLLSLLPAALAAQAQPDSAFLAQFRWRSIGPANMSGRVSDVEGNPLNPKVVYAAFATGGLWKTTNNGVSWDVLTDRAGVHAVSDVAIAPSDTSIVWIGTGEEDSRNSISPGTGVFKSTDAGRTWHFMGLRNTH